jgi:hypothetical protein
MNQLYTPAHQCPVVRVVYGLFILIVVLAVVV